MNTRVLFVLLVSALLFSPLSEASAATIEGRIMLPPGAPAPAVGELMVINITYTNVNGGGEDDGYEQVTITSASPTDGGQVYEPFSLDTTTVTGASWQIGYYFSDSPIYLQMGYYRSGEPTQWDIDLATPLTDSGSPYTGIDMTLLTGNIIGGDIRLPGGHSVPSGEIMEVKIEATNLSRPELVGYTTTITIPALGTQEAYSLPVPSESTAQWRVHYFYNDTDNSYARSGFFQSETVTTWKSELATPLDGSTSHLTTHMTLLLLNSISGTIAPPGTTAAPEDLEIRIIAKDAGTEGGATPEASPIVIENGSTTPEDYTIYVPVDPDANWRIEYEYLGDAGYLPKGYYGRDTDTSSSITVWNAEDDELYLVPGGTDTTGIELTLLESYTISGIVSLPSGYNVPEGLEVQVTYEDITNPSEWFGYTFVTLTDPTNAEAYTLSLPVEPSAEWRIHYFLPESDTFIQRGYYHITPNLTQWDPALASTFIDSDFTGDPHLTGKNIELLVGDQAIQGTISRPQTGTEPQGRIDLQVQVINYPGGWGYSRWITIEDGSPSASYTIPITNDPTAGWQVSYSYDGPYNYLTSGYYHSPTVTHWNFSEITTLAGDDDLSNIPLTLIYPPGDVNGSGLADLTDVILSLQVITNQTPAEEIKRGADVNADTRIGLEEAIHSLRTAAGLN
ncbi:hypothetical protein KQH41_00590 [bacterium]|nr:hypothetical protein [bacterium]